MKPLTDDSPGLRHCLRSLAAFSALSINWSAAEYADIVKGLARIFLRILPAEFVYVRVMDPANGPVHAAIHAHQGPVGRPHAQEIGKALDSVIVKLGGAITIDKVADPFGDGDVRVAVMPIGLEGRCGFVAAGSRHLSFPTSTDRLLLRVGVSQSALALQHRQAEDALRQSEARMRQFMEESLREADRRKEEFLATMAHELRNPLAPIRNAVQILRTRDLPAAESQWARDVIDRQVQLMIRLVDDLLDLSRIRQGKLRIRKERVNLAAAVNAAVEVSRPNIAKWGHEFHIDLPAEPIWLDADPTRLEQVLLNLLNNAAKYTPQGGRLRLSAVPEATQVVIRVQDNGIGIRADMLPCIFEMFTQVDRSLGRSQEGLGIGLALVQQLVKLHGGSIEVHSPGIGQGSEFVVRLPLAASGGGEPATPPPAVRQDPSAVEPGTQGKRILVVDDNKDAANCLAKLLRRNGNEVHTAYDGQEAVTAAAAFRPELVLLDIGLPKLDGYEAARRIRELPGGSDVVFIAVTGWGQDEDRRLSRENGFHYHLVKPIETETLQRLLTRFNLHGLST